MKKIYYNKLISINFMNFIYGFIMCFIYYYEVIKVIYFFIKCLFVIM